MMMFWKARDNAATQEARFSIRHILGMLEGTCYVMLAYRLNRGLSNYVYYKMHSSGLRG
jgi:hypothetical protein